MAKDDVGNELFEAGIFFHLAAGTIAGVLGAEQFFQIAFYVGRKTLKMPQAVKQFGRHKLTSSPNLDD